MQSRLVARDVILRYGVRVGRCLCILAVSGVMGVGVSEPGGVESRGRKGSGWEDCLTALVGLTLSSGVGICSGWSCEEWKGS